MSRLPPIRMSRSLVEPSCGSYKPFTESHKRNLTMKRILFALLLAPLAATSHAADNVPAGSELLRDPTLSKGVTQGYANHLSAAERQDCLARWTASGISGAQWAFWEISERLYFAHNRATPTMPGPGAFSWRTADDAKQCLITDGSVRMIFDTRHEWREGGKLSLPSKDGTLPKYNHGITTWPHFLIGQHFAKDNHGPVSETEKLRFGRFDRLRFTVDVKLNNLLKSSDWDHRAEFKAPNHAIFYMAFVVMPVSASRVGDAGKFYILIPAIYSEGQHRHVVECHPWLGQDQSGAGVYFTGSQPSLRAGNWVHYDTDVKQLIREALAAATKESRARGQTKTFVPEEYFLAKFLIGWEVWGGFNTDVEFKNLSLRGWPAPLLHDLEAKSNP
jgi:hypothetical protein